MSERKSRGARRAAARKVADRTAAGALILAAVAAVGWEALRDDLSSPDAPTISVTTTALDAPVEDLDVKPPYLTTGVYALEARDGGMLGVMGVSSEYIDEGEHRLTLALIDNGKDGKPLTVTPSHLLRKPVSADTAIGGSPSQHHGLGSITLSNGESKRITVRYSDGPEVYMSGVEIKGARSDWQDRNHKYRKRAYFPPDPNPLGINELPALVQKQASSLGFGPR